MDKEEYKKNIKSKILNLILSKNIFYVQFDNIGDKTIVLEKTKRFYFPKYKIMIVDNIDNDFLDIYFKKDSENVEGNIVSSFLKEIIKDLRKILITYNIKIRIKKVETEIL